jgi:hypothetical protein
MALPAAVPCAAAAGSAGRASAGSGRWICDVRTAPTSIAAMATVKNEAIVRALLFM